MADDVVARREEDRAAEGVHEPDRAEVLRPRALGDEREAAAHDRHRTDEERGARGFAEREDRDRHGDERRRAGDHGRPRRPRLPHAEHEQELRAARREQAREQERPELAAPFAADERDRPRRRRTR